MGIFRFLLGQMDGLTSRGSKQNGDVIVMLTGQNVQWMVHVTVEASHDHQSMQKDVGAESKLTPTQCEAFRELVGASKARIASLIELRSPPALSRGHGVTTVLQAVSDALGVPLLGVSTVLNAAASNQSGDALPHASHGAAVHSLTEYGFAVIDDLDLASAPES